MLTEALRGRRAVPSGASLLSLSLSLSGAAAGFAAATGLATADLAAGLAGGQAPVLPMLESQCSRAPGGLTASSQSCSGSILGGEP